LIYPDTNKAKRFITSLLPNDEYRKICLSLFLEALNKANSHGSNKWGAYYHSEGVRLLVGNLIVFTIHRNGIWLALDKQLLNEMQEKRSLLEKCGTWHWETGSYSEYKPVPSINGYYVPSSEDSQTWSIIRDFHFEYIKKVANKYEWLKTSSQSKHSPDLLVYLSNELEQSIPNPNYGYLPDNNIIYDIEKFKATNKELSETEREVIVQSRIGQGLFRDKLIEYWKGCAVTGCKLFRVLKASHIKPWYCSNNIERLDKFNGLLFVPNLDSAFDNGFISFDNEGKIIISSLLNGNDKNKLGINAEMRIRKIEINHIKYLEYHRQNIFK